MIRFYCRDCHKELWEGFFHELKRSRFPGKETLKELWDKLFCCDCIIKHAEGKGGDVMQCTCQFDGTMRVDGTYCPVHGGQ